MHSTGGRNLRVEVGGFKTEVQHWTVSRHPAYVLKFKFIKFKDLCLFFLVEIAKNAKNTICHLQSKKHLFLACDVRRNSLFAQNARKMVAPRVEVSSNLKQIGLKKTVSCFNY